ncbi:hypothetical protein MASR2M70_16230 [Bacillota bacterium]
MDLNQQMLSELAASLGLEENTETAIKSAVDMAGGYMNKNDEALMSEMLNLKSMMKSDKEQYRRQIAVLKSLRTVMGDEQQRRLDKIIMLLEE